ncbi:MAG: hypothetical protein ACOC5S_02540 [Acidobacteriota bacterium]
MKRKRKKLTSTICFLGLFLILIPWLSAQNGQLDKEAAEEGVLSVFIDWERCDRELLQKEIAFVQFVKDLSKAQLYIKVTSQKTEEEKLEYIVTFQGQNEFEGDDDELKYRVDEEKPEDEVQKKLTEKIKMGLMRHVGKTPISKQVSINFIDKVEPTAVEDKWNFWVFSLSANTFMNGEESYSSSMISGSFTANRITPELKTIISVSSYFMKDEFRFNSDVIKSDSESHNLNGLIVKSISEHWSVGGFFSILSATYSNIQLRVNPAPAVEYNFFPYSESTKKQLRLLYRLGFNSIRYREETIYEKTYENLWQQALSLTLELKQKWGTVSTSIEGSNYFHDFSKNRLQLNSELSWRLTKGLNFNIHGTYSRIRDQLFLPRGEASLEEILLQRRQLETGYSYYISVGLSYTFGSTQSKVVNPRFGSGGTSISISF